MKYFRSMKGKITITLLFFLIVFTGTSIYVYQKNQEIFKLHSDIIKHSERTVREVFVFHFGMNQSLFHLHSAYLNEDTSANAAYKGSLNVIRETRAQMKAHCDSLGLNVFTTTAEKNDSLFNVYLDDAKYIMKTIVELKADPNPAEKREQLRQMVAGKLTGDFWNYSNTVSEVMDKVNPQREEKIKLLEAKTNQIRIVLFVIISISIISFLLVWFRLSRIVSFFLETVTSHLNRISEGELVKEPITTKDELAEILESSNKVVENLGKASEFALAVGQGKFESSFTPAGDRDSLGKALVDMRNDLQKFKKEDERRLWINEGYNQFSEILRQNNDNLQELADRSIAFLVKYMNASQGSLFLVYEDENGQPDGLELLGCYAYSRKKFVEGKLGFGEGMVGQAYLEKNYIYVTDVPSNYVKITSGLGEANPRVILVMPMVVDGQVMGVFEIASFEKFEKFKIEFLEKAAKDMASVLLTVKNTVQTQKLVTQLRSSSEQMHGQEEELRQNMEELMATQEEMRRKEGEYLQRIERLENEQRQTTIRVSA